MRVPRSVVLLHGFAGTPAAWDDVIRASYTARGAVSYTARPIALPGHGTEPASSWEDTLDRLADEIGGASVIGYSLGARLALGLIARDAIPTALLISVNPGLDDGARAGRRADDARWAALLRAEGTAAFVDAWEAQPLFTSAAAAPEERRARRREARRALDAEHLARSLETLGLAEMPDLRWALAERATRVRLLVGDLDTRFVTYAQAAADRSPTLEIELLAGVGHDPTLEAPELLASRLAAWID